MTNVQAVRALFLRQLGKVVTQQDILAAIGYTQPSGDRADFALAHYYVTRMRTREAMRIERVRGQGWVLRGFLL